MRLSEVLSGAAYKKLALVDLPGRGSRQHEINGVQALREFFKTESRIEGTIVWHYFAEDNDAVEDVGTFTFYDARQHHRTRTEWRMYYVGDFLFLAQEEDVLLLVRTKSFHSSLHGLVFQKNSSWLRCAEQLFGVTSLNPTNFETFSEDALRSTEMGLLGLQIIEALGISEPFSAVVPNDDDLLMERFGRRFPTTALMSHFARELVGEVDLSNPDEVLVRWLEREEQLFRALEKMIVGEQVRAGFADVDDFLAFSLSVQNRRKSRMGLSLQNNLASLFTTLKLRFEPQGFTEGRNRPDFLFPGSREYRDPDFDVRLLAMLGAKSTLKERWRQVLTEANKISVKHLCTLEPGISLYQTEDIRGHSVQLVIPLSFHKTYLEEQREQLWTIGTFVNFVRTIQLAT
jgi:EcoRII C terminal